MMDRRTKRSADRTEALQFLVESVADRSDVRALVLLDDGGHIVAGTGMPEEVAGLARAALDVAWRRASAREVDTLTKGADVTARPVPTRDGMMYFAALGDRMSGLGDALRAVHRILAA
ncbi:MAG TPA: hypothetical protein VIY73_09635 [Polyangiaceae bacterium]